MIKNTVDCVMYKMLDFCKGDAKQIQHFVKVHRYAQIIGEAERIAQKDQLVLEVASIVHDIGIKVAEEKFGYSNAKLQEQEGPAVALELLSDVKMEEEAKQRVAYLVSRHHTYTDVRGDDYEILLEADFLVNFYEEGYEKEKILTIMDNVFRTQTGKTLCRIFFDVE